MMKLEKHHFVTIILIFSENQQALNNWMIYEEQYNVFIKYQNIFLQIT